MKIFFIIFLIIIFLLISIQAYRIIYYTKISHKLVLKAYPFSVTEKNAVGSFLILGDSLGVGVGSSQADSIAGRFHKEFPLVNIDNRSVSGAKIKDGLKTLGEIKPGTHYNLSIIILGANDIVRFTSEKDALRDLQELLTITQKISDKTIFVTSGSVGFAPVFIEPLSSIYTQRSLKFFKGFEEIASTTGVMYVSLYSPRSTDPFTKNPDKYYAGDKFHPSGAGYGLWFERIKVALSS